MTKNNSKRKNRNRNSKKEFLERLPSSAPFPKIVRRPDYQLRRGLKIKRLERSKVITVLLIVIFMSNLFVFMGGMRMITYEVNHAFDPLSEPDKPLVIWRSRYPFDFRDQTLLEGFAVGTLIFIGASGMYIINLSTQYAYSPAIAAKLLFLGIFLTTFALAGLMFVFNVKRGLYDEKL